MRASPESLDPEEAELPSAPARPAGEGTPADIEARIYASVFEGVMSQRLAPGTKLPEARLCELFGVSRAVVRKVLQRLAHDHIVQLRPHRGAIVAVPTRAETQQIFEARRALEAAIVRLVAERATPADLQGLREQLRQEHAQMHRHDQPAWARLASAYHLRLAELSGNPILRRYLTETVSRCSLLVATHQPPGNAACEHEEHERIVDCIARGDADAAVQLMEQHLLALEHHLLLDRPTPKRDLAYLLGLGQA
ncbi:GntR family transcriptional regulator [Ramlibacter rhizophilus]|uniref:GntR family transcriptional regulator n=1 Tax=Ramlibacter rhizophilus TaxID=1781167 RepID=A0A4Z0BJB1_9BURK|nr:GntR family transcriptional regulator [Ramlibacter rhizophilus]TFY98509.1 GntR family transcriptional regulator [Ramlibacter rhizophilus]